MHAQEAFRKVDLDYVFNVAEAARKSGCKQFHLVCIVLTVEVLNAGFSLRRKISERGR